MSNDGPREIQPPKKFPVSTTARNLLEAAAESIPLGGIATVVIKAAFPPNEDKDRDRWAGELTGRVNELDQQLNSSITIEGLPAQLARWMTKTSKDGLYDPDQPISEILPHLGLDLSLESIDEAAEELAEYGLIELVRDFGDSIIQPKLALFINLDPEIKGWDPIADSKVLARLALVQAEGVGASELEMQSGFEHRRFNPAFSYLLGFFDQDLISQELEPDYQAGFAHLSSGARRRLRRFIGDK